MKRKEIEELEYLAREFIIDTKPLTAKQKELLENIAAMETQLQLHKRKTARIERVINKLYEALRRSYFEEEQ